MEHAFIPVLLCCELSLLWSTNVHMSAVLLYVNRIPVTDPLLPQPDHIHRDLAPIHPHNSFISQGSVPNPVPLHSQHRVIQDPHPVTRFLSNLVRIGTWKTLIRQVTRCFIWIWHNSNRGKSCKLAMAGVIIEYFQTLQQHVS